ncbi:MAG TPA: hypothetical protein VGW38_09325 [Chloroflexota bacterium]|nr:hypothetical protein [Chloroflexota bacterium]
MATSPGLSAAGRSKPTTTTPSQGHPAATGGGALALARGVGSPDGAGVLANLADLGRRLEEDTTRPSAGIAYGGDTIYFRPRVHRSEVAGVVGWSQT